MVKKISLKITLLFFIFNLIFVPIGMTLMIRWLPFTNVREEIVSSLVSTLSHGYLAKVFASEEEIERIDRENKNGVMQGTTDSNRVRVAHKNDKGIELYEIKSSRFSGKLLIINDATRIKVGVSKNIPKSGETTSAICERENAVAGINAGGFGDTNWSGTGGMPTGFVISDGRIVYKPQMVKESTDIVGFTKKGVLVVGKHKVSNLLKNGINQAVFFGPALVVNGQPMIKSGDGGKGIAPRTAIGQTRDGKVILLVIDGRHINSLGATLLDLQNIMIKYGAFNASNLDGGSSTTMYYKNRVINNPSDVLGERSVPTVFLVKP